MLLSGDRMICGVGVDLVEVQRIENILERWGERFTERVFTKREIAYCRERARPAVHYAARFAAKEAFLKSISLSGLAGGLRLRDIETLNDQHGKPFLNLRNKAKAALNNNDISTTAHLSVSHTVKYATAIVILERIR